MTASVCPLLVLCRTKICFSLNSLIAGDDKLISIMSAHSSFQVFSPLPHFLFNKHSLMGHLSIFIHFISCHQQCQHGSHVTLQGGNNIHTTYCKVKKLYAIENLKHRTCVSVNYVYNVKLLHGNHAKFAFSFCFEGNN